MATRNSITVIVPTLNRPSLVKKCLESVAKQTLQPTECVIVDQSDNEDTKKLLEEMDMKNIQKIHVKQKIKSLLLARNRGLDEAGDTEYICFLDDDIQIYPNYLEILAKRLEEDREKKYAGGMGTYDVLNWRRDYFAEFFMMPHFGDGKFLANGMPTFPHCLQKYSDVEFLSGGMTIFRNPILKIRKAWKSGAISFLWLGVEQIDILAKRYLNKFVL